MERKEIPAVTTPSRTVIYLSKADVMDAVAWWLKDRGEQIADGTPALRFYSERADSHDQFAVFSVTHDRAPGIPLRSYQQATLDKLAGKDVVLPPGAGKSAFAPPSPEPSISERIQALEGALNPANAMSPDARIGAILKRFAALENEKFNDEMVNVTNRVLKRLDKIEQALRDAPHPRPMVFLERQATEAEAKSMKPAPRTACSNCNGDGLEPQE